MTRRSQAHRFHPAPTFADRAWVWAGLLAAFLGGLVWLAALWVLFSLLLLGWGGGS